MAELKVFNLTNLEETSEEDLIKWKKELWDLMDRAMEKGDKVASATFFSMREVIIAKLRDRAKKRPYKAK